MVARLPLRCFSPQCFAHAEPSAQNIRIALLFLPFPTGLTYLSCKSQEAPLPLKTQPADLTDVLTAPLNAPFTLFTLAALLSKYLFMHPSPL